MYLPVNIRLLNVNVRAMRSERDRAISERRESREAANSLVREKVIGAKSELIASAKNHSVTSELENGEDEGSSLLAGYGTLSSFVGFKQGSNPAKEVIDFLEESVEVRENETRKVSGKLLWRVKVALPELEDFDTAGVAEIPWMIGKSFVSQIEVGIPGVNRYLHKRKDTPGSRSHHGWQSKYDITNRAEISEPKAKYMSELLAAFKRSVT